MNRRTVSSTLVYDAATRTEGIQSMKRRTEITIETDRVLVLSRHSGRVGTSTRGSYGRPYVWCLSCADHVRPLSTDEAAIQAHVSSLTIFHWVEAELLHYIESSEGLLLICPNSLQPPVELLLRTKIPTKP